MKRDSTVGVVARSVSWLWAASLVGVPLLYVLVMSFLTRGTYGGVVGGFTGPFTTENYVRIVDPDMAPLLLASLWRSLGLATLTTVLCVLVGFPLSLFLVFRAGRFKETLLFLLIVPFWTNFLIRTYSWYVILSDNGWLNSVLEHLGFGPEATRLLFTPYAVLIGMFYNYLPYMAMSLYVSLEKLDPKLLEAAADLGASPLKRFFSVTLPNCVPGLFAGSLMVFIPAMGEFVIPDVLGGGTSLFVGNLLAQQFLVVRNWPFGAALSVILMVFIAGCMRFLNRATNGKLESELLA